MTWFYIIGGRCKCERRFAKIGITDDLERRLATIYQSDHRRRHLLPYTSYLHTVYRFESRATAAKVESLLLTRLSIDKVDRKTMGWFHLLPGLLDIYADHVASTLGFDYVPGHALVGRHLSELVTRRSTFEALHSFAA